MRKYDSQKSAIIKKITDFSANSRQLSGISTPSRIKTLAEQIISSLRRIEYVKTLDQRRIPADRQDPRSPLFDPLKAAVLLRNAGDLDEAIWIVFLGTHFGKHAVDGWRLSRDIYGAFGTRPNWTWSEITGNRAAFSTWTRRNLPGLLNDGVSRRFSNHRKYESRKPDAIESVLLSYVDTVTAHGDHRGWITTAHQKVGQNPVEAFDWLYNEMGTVHRFGRLGTFDFLTMIGKLDLFPIEPGFAYLQGATGPLRGARLLLDNNPTSNTSAQTLERVLADLDNHLGAGKQVLEDSLCNWQKSPDQYVYFKG